MSRQVTSREEQGTMCNVTSLPPILITDVTCGEYFNVLAQNVQAAYFKYKMVLGNEGFFNGMECFGRI